MSTFRVKLNNTSQGLLDIDPSTGVQASTSKQRTVFIAGPRKTQRLLKDGDTFTDANYYKRFCYPQVSYELAILEVVSDDGTVWSDVESENTYPVVWLPGAAGTGVVGIGETYTDTNMSLDILTTYGAPARFCQLQNTDTSDAIKVRLNGTAVMTLDKASSQIFDQGDMSITKIEFDNSFSGAAQVNAVEVILGIKSVSNS